MPARLQGGDRLPDGSSFQHWDDETVDQDTIHVAQGDLDATDSNPGTRAEPLETISAAAERVEPGETVVVHEGIYRERIAPARGGTAPDRMIAYEAAPDENVIVRGSRVWTPAFERSDTVLTSVDATVWTGTLPRDWFVGYNPFATRNVTSANRYYLNQAADGTYSRAEHERFMQYRGMVFVDGEPLEQVYYPHELNDAPGRYWVEDPGLQIHLRMPDDRHPQEATIEVTTEEQLFAPRRPGLGYIRVSGFTFEHAADGIPIPQRAMVSATRGHHWIIENNEIRWANACGIDVGNTTWHFEDEEIDRADDGHHIIRNNHISHCGICGIASMGNNRFTLVEDNLIEHIGRLQLERGWETGGLKFHLCEHVLIRNNVVRHIRDAPGIWLDFRNRNSRITGNVIGDVRSLNGGIYLEVTHDPVWIDHNIVWNVRAPTDDDRDQRRGPGINVDTGEQATVAHNLIGRVRDGFAISANLNQAQREVDGRVGLCRDHSILNNVVIGSPRRIEFGRAADNRSNGNVFDSASDDMSFHIASPEPEQWLNLDAWRRHAGFDRDGAHCHMDASFDPRNGTLTLSVDNDSIPEPIAIEGMDDAIHTVGPLEISPGNNAYDISQQ